jgi:2,4-dienoyl-CoA reductase-like NADH-dependent reductase (Old Yellow Enzyme family)
MNGDPIFEPISIHDVRFRNRILRSSIGGRSCNYDGTVTDVWKNFEKRFADGGVGGIVSTTFHVNEKRRSPFQYPSIASRRCLPFLRKYLPQIQGAGEGCRYIMQIGDPGYATYVQLLPDRSAEASASDGFDLMLGYANRRRMMSDADIERSIDEYAVAAARVREAGADGVEITASKGYLVHQFLNPGINRRSDAWGGDEDRRFHFLERIMQAVRERIGPDFLLGIRLSGADFNSHPLVLALLRWPPVFMSRESWVGNDAEQMRRYALRLEALGADYLHVVAGYGFPNPRDLPGRFPFEEIRIFFDSIRHLSGKAAFRSTLLHTLPMPVWRAILNLGWHRGDEVNLDLARRMRLAVRIPVIANGGFQAYRGVRDAVATGGCDMVSMARALLANPDLVKAFFREGDDPAKAARCTQCNRCIGRTTTSPLGCYERKRFDSDVAMLEQIMALNRADEPDVPDAAEITNRL